MKRPDHLIPPNAPKAGASAEERRRRQAEALRANLRRRKAAQRDEAEERSAGDSGKPPAGRA
jgi:hypothetical protein